MNTFVHKKKRQPLRVLTQNVRCTLGMKIYSPHQFFCSETWLVVAKFRHVPYVWNLCRLFNLVSLLGCRKILGVSTSVCTWFPSSHHVCERICVSISTKYYSTCSVVLFSGFVTKDECLASGSCLSLWFCFNQEIDASPRIFLLCFPARRFELRVHPK